MKGCFKHYWHQEHQISISFKDGTWIGYDDPESVTNKVTKNKTFDNKKKIFLFFLKCKYVKREGFAGAMMWSLDMDDFSGKFCRKNRKKSLIRFPLINAMKKEFEKVEINEEMTTILSIQTTTLSNETILLNEEFQILLDQMFEEASSSSKFFQSYFIRIYLFIILFSSNKISPV